MDGNLNQNPQELSASDIPPPPPQPEDQPPAAPIAPKTKKDTIIGGAFLLAIFIFLGLAIYFAYQNRLLKNELSQVQKTQQTPFSTQTPDPTADWKIYISELGIYQFKYPPYLNSLTKIKTDDRFGEVEKFQLTNQNQDFMSILITVFKDSPVYGITKEEYVESFRKDAQASGTDSPTMIWGGAKNVKINQDISGIEFGWGGVDPTHHIVFDGKGYIFDFLPTLMGMELEESQEFINTTYQILSTFKFINISNSIKYPGWFQYTRPQLKNVISKQFILHYPPEWNIKEDLVGGLNLKLEHTNGDYLEIIQDPTDAGRCRFPDEPDYDNPLGFARLGGNYLEIEKGNIKWRFVQHPEQERHLLCQLYDNDPSNIDWSGLTSIGALEIKITNQENYNQVVDILKRVEISQ